MNNKKIFISYCWKDEKYADFIDNSFNQVGIKLIRDKRDLTYGNSIKDFARKVRSASAIICLISNEFLHKENCMYEILVSMGDLNFKRKFCPIIINYAENKVDLTYEGIDEYARFWNSECERIEKLINSQQDNISKAEYIGTLKNFTKIYQSVKEFLFILIDTIYILNSDIDTKGIKSIGESIFKKIGINPKVNIDYLLEIAQSDTVETAETLLARYLRENIFKENEYYFYTKASIYERFNYTDLAFYNYKMATEVNPKFVLAYEAILKMFIKDIIPHDNNYLKKLITVLDELDKDNPNTLIVKGLLSFKNNQFTDAISHFEEAEKKTNAAETIYILNSLGQAYEMLYEREDNKDYYGLSIDYYKRAIERNKNYYQAYNNLAVIYLKTKKTGEALNTINVCLKLKPDYCHGLNTLGLIQEDMKDYKNALISYSKAYQSKSDFSAPLTNIAFILDYRFKNELCGVYYKLSYDLNPNSLIDNFNLGNYYRKYTDEKNNAFALLSKAYNLDPENILCNMALGLYHCSMNEYDVAMEYFAKATVLSRYYEPAIFCLLICETYLNQDTTTLLHKHNSLCKDSNYYPIITWRDSIVNTNFDIYNFKAEILPNLFDIVEIDYVEVREKITKTSFINPQYTLNNAYRYIVDNFYELN